MKLRKYDQRQLEDAVKKSTSLRQVLEILGVAPYGGNYEVLRRAIRYFNLDTSHFTGQSWNKGKTLGPKQPLQKFLSNEKRIASFKLKNRLLAEGILKPQCSSCGRIKWLNQAIPLELDHVNGNRSDNQLLNLRLLCPNCHALTPTYRGKNIAARLSSVLPG
jgi:hypothetical protein